MGIFLGLIISIAGIIWGFEYLIEAPMIAWLIWLLTIIISIWCINNLSNGESSKSAFDELSKKQEKAEQKKYNELHGGVRCPKCNENAGQEISPTSQGVAAGIAKCMGESPYVYFAHRKKYCCKNCGHSW